MIYITGDVHIPTEDVQKLNTKRFPEQKLLSEKDYLIICGDFGGVWDGSNQERYWIKWLNNKSFTTLFVDGNHENFDRLNEYEVTVLHGGKVQKIADSVFRLMRGQVFQIEGKKIFTMGGASSHDREYRKEGKSWWKEELPSESEYAEACANLSDNGYNADLVITHCAPTFIQQQIKPEYKPDKLTDFLDNLRMRLTYDKWFFGHYHIDCEVDEKHTAVFNNIIKIL